MKLGRKVARGGGAVKPKAKAGRGAGVGSGVGERREADGAGERSVDGTTSELSEKVSGSSPSSRAADSAPEGQKGVGRRNHPAAEAGSHAMEGELSRESQKGSATKLYGVVGVQGPGLGPSSQVTKTGEPSVQADLHNPGVSSGVGGPEEAANDAREAKLRRRPAVSTSAMAAPEDSGRVPGGAPQLRGSVIAQKNARVQEPVGAAAGEESVAAGRADDEEAENVPVSEVKRTVKVQKGGERKFSTSTGHEDVRQPDETRPVRRNNDGLHDAPVGVHGQGRQDHGRGSTPCEYSVQRTDRPAGDAYQVGSRSHVSEGWPAGKEPEVWHRQTEAEEGVYEDAGEGEEDFTADQRQARYTEGVPLGEQSEAWQESAGTPFVDEGREKSRGGAAVAVAGRHDRQSRSTMARSAGMDSSDPWEVRQAGRTGTAGGGKGRGATGIAVSREEREQTGKKEYGERLSGGLNDAQSTSET